MLTDMQIRKAATADKPYKLSDAGGLYLFVSPTGGKVWRLKYRIAGKEKLLTIGPYPAVSLSAARDAREAAKTALRAGRDPGQERKRAAEQSRLAEAGAATFETVAREWHDINRGRWTKTHAADIITSLERDVFPVLGSRAVDGIEPPDVLGVLRTIEARGAVETAHRIRQRMSAVFVHAISSGVGRADPAAIVKPALRPVTGKRRQPAVASLDEARATLMAVEAAPGAAVTKLAMRLLALTAVRPGVVRGARWDEMIDLHGAEPVWRVPAERMKMALERKGDETNDFVVPLAPQAVEVIEAVRPLTGRGPLLFPNDRWAHKPMSENALGYALNRAGYHKRHVPHGWRATFSTAMNELAIAEGRPGDRAIIDMMLAHAPKDKVESAYNRAAHMARRRELALMWANMLMVGMPPAAELLGSKRR